MASIASTTTPSKAPKSYLLDDKVRAGLLREGGMEAVYIGESLEAELAGDGDVSWAWLKKVTLPAHTLLFFKRMNGAQFIRDMGFITIKADVAYGPGWLDRDI